MIPRTFGRVVVGVDGSPGSMHALRHALDLARHFGCPLIPVLAWQPPGGEMQSSRTPRALECEWEKIAQRRLFTAFDEALGTLPADVHCEPQIVRGPTGKALLWMADRPDDLLVVGAGRRGRMGRALHTRTAQYCVAHATCCIVAVPPPPLAGTPRRLRDRSGWLA